jgi:hypothetical protein
VLLSGLALAGAAAAMRAEPGPGGLRAGAVAGVWSGMVGALVVFLLITGESFGFPDPVRDAPTNLPESIRHDPHALAAAGVGDALAGAINLLWLMPAGAVLLGCVGAAVAQAARFRDRPRPA